MTSMTADDFIKGLLAVLVLKGTTKISIRNDEFDRAVAPIFKKLQSLAPNKQIDLRFRIRLHPFYGDSITARNAIVSAAQHGLISLDNPEFLDITLKFDSAKAEKILEKIPGGKDLFVELAQDLNVDGVIAV